MNCSAFDSLKHFNGQPINVTALYGQTKFLENILKCLLKSFNDITVMKLITSRKRKPMESNMLYHFVSKDCIKFMKQSGYICSEIIMNGDKYYFCEVLYLNCKNRLVGFFGPDAYRQKIEHKFFKFNYLKIDVGNPIYRIDNKYLLAKINKIIMKQSQAVKVDINLRIYRNFEKLFERLNIKNDFDIEGMFDKLKIDEEWNILNIDENSSQIPILTSNLMYKNSNSNRYFYVKKSILYELMKIGSPIFTLKSNNNIYIRTEMTICLRRNSNFVIVTEEEFKLFTRATKLWNINFC